MPAEAKTKPTETDPGAFLECIADEAKRADAFRLLHLMQRVSGEPPVMWGPSIIGFGRYRYRYASGHQGEFASIGFSPRKSALVIYVVPGFDAHPDLMARLGKYTRGKSCLYVKRLADVDEAVLEELIARSLAWVLQTYPD